MDTHKKHKVARHVASSRSKDGSLHVIRSTLKVHKLLYLGSFVLFVVIMFFCSSKEWFRLKENGEHPKIYALVQSSGGGRFATSAIRIDPSTGSSSSIVLGSTFCGAAYEVASAHTLFSCGVGTAYGSFFSIDERTGKTDGGLIADPAQSLRNPVVCESRLSPRVGTCYYSFGTGELRDGETVATATMVIADHGGTHLLDRISVPHADLGRIPSKLMIASDRLLLLTVSNPKLNDIVYRYDLDQKTFLSSIDLGMKGIDAVIIADRLYVSGYQESPFITRVRGYDLESGKQVWDSGSLHDVTGLATDGSDLFVASAHTLSIYGVRSGVLIRERELSEKYSLWSLVYHGGRIFGGDPAGYVHEFESSTLDMTRTWDANGLGPGALILAGIE